MDKLELLYDHYKDTYGLVKDAQSNRNKTFLFLNIALVINLLFVIEPTSVIIIATSWLKESHGVDIRLQVEIFQVFLWLILLYFTMRYVQVNCYIERQYRYIHQLEKSITDKSEIKIDRESENYLGDYPFVLKGVHIFYTWIFPILFGIAIAYKIIIEIRNSAFGIPVVFSCIIFLCCLVLFFLYFCFLHKTTKSDKKSKNIREKRK